MRYAVRLAAPSDSEALLRIYAPYVMHTAASFETRTPDAEEFSRRIEAIGRQYPYLVCQVDDEIVGYAYASRHRERDAYRYDVDVAIYVQPAYHGSGIAYTLYDRLFAILRALGYYNAYAVCTLPNEKSVKFHEKWGFQLIGIHHKTGYKLGRWHDVAWFEKALNAHGGQPAAIQAITALSDECINGMLNPRSLP